LLVICVSWDAFYLVSTAPRVVELTGPIHRVGVWKRDEDFSLVHIPNQLGPVGNAKHVTAEDEVEGMCVRPLALDVVDFEFDVGWDPGALDIVEKVSPVCDGPRSQVPHLWVKWTYHSGWMGLKSLPSTCFTVSVGGLSKFKKTLSSTAVESGPECACKEAMRITG